VSEVKQVTDAEFEDAVIRSSTPVLVDFYGTWCAPCQQLKPVIAEIAAELAGKLTVVEAEITQAPESAGRFDVLGVPTLALVVDGEVRDSITGSPSKSDILAMVGKHVQA
jgi:thioredoxin 1